MKLKFTQSAWVESLNKLVNVGEEHVVEDIKVAESLVKAEFATIVEEVKKIKDVVKDKKAPAKDGE